MINELGMIFVYFFYSSSLEKFKHFLLNEIILVYFFFLYRILEFQHCNTWGSLVRVILEVLEIILMPLCLFLI